MSDSRFETLLVLQAHDSKIDQLVYRRETLPARATLEQLMGDAGRLRDSMTQAVSERDTTARRTREIEAEVARLEARIKEINDRLYGNSPIASKDALALQEEVKHLEEQKSSQEDAELELMEAIEPQKVLVAQLEADARALSGQLETAKGEIAKGEAEVDAELTNERAAREQISQTVEPSLLAKYEMLRPKLGGVAIAAVEGGKCGGCHLSMSAAALDELRHAAPEVVVTCEECGRMLAH